MSEEEPAEQPTGRSSRGSRGKHSSKRGGHGRRNSRKSASSKPHGGEEHGEDDLENDHARRDGHVGGIGDTRGGGYFHGIISFEIRVL